MNWEDQLNSHRSVPGNKYCWTADSTRTIRRVHIPSSVLVFVAIIGQAVLCQWVLSMPWSDPTRQYWEPILSRLYVGNWFLVLIPWLAMAILHLVSAIRARQFGELCLAAGIILAIRGVLYVFQCFLAFNIQFRTLADNVFVMAFCGALALTFAGISFGVLMGPRHWQKLFLSVGIGMLFVDPIFVRIDNSVAFVLTWACGVALLSFAVHRWAHARRWRLAGHDSSA